MKLSVKEMLHVALSENIDFDSTIFAINAVDVLDLGSADNLWIAVKTFIAGGLRKIMVNMEGLEFIDSIGISVIINSAKLIRTKKGDLVLINVPERIENIFKPINLNRFIHIFPSENDAVNYFKFV